MESQAKSTFASAFHSFDGRDGDPAGDADRAEAFAVARKRLRIALQPPHHVALPGRQAVVRRRGQSSLPGRRWPSSARRWRGRLDRQPRLRPCRHGHIRARHHPGRQRPGTEHVLGRLCRNRNCREQDRRCQQYQCAFQAYFPADEPPKGALRLILSACRRRFTRRLQLGDTLLRSCEIFGFLEFLEQALVVGQRFGAAARHAVDRAIRPGGSRPRRARCRPDRS